MDEVPWLLLMLLALLVGIAVFAWLTRPVGPPEGGRATRQATNRTVAHTAQPITAAPPQITSQPALGTQPTDPVSSPDPSGIAVIGPSQPVVVGPSEAVVVAPPPRGAWDERGWACRDEGNHQAYEGTYQVLNRQNGQLLRYQGRVEVKRKQAVPYIADPPTEIKRHPKATCFTPHNLPWFRVNWYRPATNVDDAILYVEKVLDEAVNRYGAA